MCRSADARDMGAPRCRRVPAVAFTPHIPIQSHTSPGPANMPSKPNYKFQRAERDRAKKASMDTKLEERKQQAALRKTREASGEEPSEGSSPGSEE
jgi:hypothetical protein